MVVGAEIAFPVSPQKIKNNAKKFEDLQVWRTGITMKDAQPGWQFYPAYKQKS